MCWYSVFICFLFLSSVLVVAPKMVILSHCIFIIAKNVTVSTTYGVI